MTNLRPFTTRDNALLDSFGCIQSAWIDALGTAGGAWIGAWRDAGTQCGEQVLAALAGRPPHRFSADRAPIQQADAARALIDDWLRLMAHVEVHVTLLQECVREALDETRERWSGAPSIAVGGSARAPTNIPASARSDDEDGGDADAPAERSIRRRRAA
ncbi:MAG: hypothetical protein KDG52_14870 [Rhodocyclaceae bacterium]|nr:hypothetical protein [Rhodocyclaceae bacterium]